ncbi:uncharacterized protein BHQ10_003438 [Talaromyces amestolkiae]|uniref:Zn(2)-C6 fungal-type domain-containing protein n=1 Tax=Talaromyces amestolkiae TaxID=1196081 RepID=A0A364KV48_TALAM|nr:uncharacterized protein BHQ10_003438 [Talaromyces amestolkiae]RAO67426.1 hypothetical protein BHQ10_003438 [Talaromyces amestolkiae]
MTGDEGKPRCRNCIDKGFQCQYGSQLTFLTKNVITVSTPEVPRTYSTIKFVSEDPQSILNESSSWEDEDPLTPTDVPEFAESRPISVPPPAIGAITTVLQQDEQTPHEDSSFPHWAHCESESPGLDLDPRLSFYSPQDQPSNPSYHHHEDHLRHDTLPVLSRGLHPEPEVISPVVLDLCDMYQSFGIAAFQYAIDSEQIFRALILLSEASLRNRNLDGRSLAEQSRSHSSRDMSSLELDYNESGDGNHSLMTIALTTIFRRAHVFVSNLSRAWSTNDFALDMDVVSSLIMDIATSKPTAAIYWLFLRLELSSALANDATIQFPLPLSLPWEPLDIFPETMDSLAGLTWRLSNYAHRPLMILGQTMQLISKDGGGGFALPGANHIDSWKHLINELERWRKQRPEEFRPIMELPSSSVEPDSSFPTILFTNGAGIFGNQLYHTAMLLLLLDKPRTVRLNYLPPFVLSPLWHAQCICSISLNDDRRECWDPCLLASFLFAAKRMTHEIQQQDILHGLNRIQSLTGWDIREHVVDLQQKWSLLNAV